MIAQTSRRFAEDIALLAQLAAREERAAEVRPEHVAQALRGMGWQRRPDWLNGSLIAAGGVGVGVGVEGFIAAWLDSDPDKMAAYTVLWLIGAGLGAWGLVRRAGS